MLCSQNDFEQNATGIQQKIVCQLFLMIFNRLQIDVPLIIDVSVDRSDLLELRKSALVHMQCQFKMPEYSTRTTTHTTHRAFEIIRLRSTNLLVSV